jgi:hypothetical protein
MTKKLLAINNETGESFEFGIEDIWAVVSTRSIFNGEEMREAHIQINNRTLNHYSFNLGFKDYSLYYNHQGKYYNYKTGEVLDAETRGVEDAN